MNGRYGAPAAVGHGNEEIRMNQPEYLGELHQAITAYEGAVRQAVEAYTEAVTRAGTLLRRRQDAARDAFLGNGHHDRDGELREVTR